MKKAHFVDSFLDGFTGAGLFARLRRPGAATEFVDSRSVEEFVDSRSVEEFADGGEYGVNITKFSGRSI